MPVELSPDGGVSDFLHRTFESGDVPDAPDWSAATLA